MTLLRTSGLTAGYGPVTVLHDLNLAAQYCDRLLLLSRGKVAAYGTIPEVLTYRHVREVFDVVVHHAHQAAGVTAVALAIVHGFEAAQATEGPPSLIRQSPTGPLVRLHTDERIGPEIALQGARVSRADPPSNRLQLRREVLHARELGLQLGVQGRIPLPEEELGNRLPGVG